jgi:tRNA-Thr(GGU) m(6)t(6)A37 methyltransferase TsaA
MKKAESNWKLAPENFLPLEATRNMEIAPIGVIHTPFQRPDECPAQGAFSEVEGVATIEPQYAEGLDDLDGFSHVWLIYWFHRSGPFKLKVMPMLDKTPRGLFASRAPIRPNPIGMTAVRIIEVVGAHGVRPDKKMNDCRGARRAPLHIRFQGADMLDGTPLLDIKPYVPAFDQRENVKVGWLEKVLKQKGVEKKFRHKKS